MKTENRARRLMAVALACVIATCSFPGVTLAGPSESAEVAAARDSFNKALALEQEGRFEEALEKLEITAKVKLTPQVRFHIGRCKEGLGKWGEAIEAYEAAAEQAESEKRAPEVLKAARALAEKLEAARPKLTVSFGNGPKPDSLLVDGTSVEGNVAKDYPVDPGPHVVIATRGEDKLREEFVLGKGESKTLTLEFDDRAKPKPAAAPSAKPSIQPQTTTSTTSPKTSGTRTVGWIVGGFGVASLAAAGALYAVRINALDELEGACTADLRCPRSAESTRDRAKTFTMLSGVALGVGAAALGVGTVLILAGKSSAEAPKTARARFVPYAPNANLFGFGIEGAF